MNNLNSVLIEATLTGNARKVGDHVWLSLGCDRVQPDEKGHMEVVRHHFEASCRGRLRDQVRDLKEGRMVRVVGRLVSHNTGMISIAAEHVEIGKFVEDPEVVAEREAAQAALEAKERVAHNANHEAFND